MAPRHHNLGLAWIALALLGALLPGLRATAEETPLPDIIARKFDLKIERRSNSNLTYLLRAPEGGPPGVGKILLIRSNETPIVALRVLKQYPEKDSFAAKRVRRYGDFRVLDKTETYIALEKKQDAEGTPPPPVTQQDQADLQELESPATPADAAAPEPAPPAPPAQPPDENVPDVSEYDAELDSGTSPLPDSEGDDEGEENSGLGIEETKNLDPYRHTLSAQFGFMTNVDPESKRYLFSGGGLRYGYSPFRLLFFRGSAVQDSLTIEGGLFVYKIVKFLSTANAEIDTYTVVPTVLALRYNLALSETFTVFFYAGMLKNWVISATNGVAAAVEFKDNNPFTSLNSLVPAVGGGFFFQIGPNWSARIDAGLDFIGAGLVLKF